MLGRRARAGRHRLPPQLFAGIDDLRFKRLVEPGDDLTLVCEIEAVRGPVGRGRATAKVGMWVSGDSVVLFDDFRIEDETVDTPSGPAKPAPAVK